MSSDWVAAIAPAVVGVVGTLSVAWTAKWNWSNETTRALREERLKAYLELLNADAGAVRVALSRDGSRAEVGAEMWAAATRVQLLGSEEVAEIVKPYAVAALRNAGRLEKPDPPPADDKAYSSTRRSLIAAMRRDLQRR